ncbi:HEPN domain-containing protein [Priestia sp. YIM B13448]|uniref:HEPN domain-containing protein n=1 Tax=Priestia sp. YIM B13448 TaxID=3366308 RepID=UPI00366B8861
MSVELNLLLEAYIEKEDIEKVILELGFKEDDKHENSYLWYDEGFLSTRGCWFSFNYQDSYCINEEKQQYKDIKTLCGTSTNAGRSYYDLEMQLEVIRKLQSKFGGIIHNPDDDEYGVFENCLPQLSKTEMACGIAYLHFINNLHKVKTLIEEVDMEKVKRDGKFGTLMFNVPLLRNNTLVPFCLSVLETFLRQFFTRFLQTNEEAMNEIFKQKEQLNYSVVQELLKGEKSIIDIELEKYSFQSFKSANKAYVKYLGIDLYKDVLRNTLLYDGKETTIISVLTELIEKRHRIIHEAALEDDLGQEKMDKYYFFLKAFGEVFINTVMEKRKLRLLINEEL